MCYTNLEGEYLDIAHVQEKEQDGILEKTNVVGCSVANKIKDDRETGDPSLTIYVSQKMDKADLPADAMIPKAVGKFKTDVVETGDIFAGDQIPDEEICEEDTEADIQTLKQRWRPAKGGCSVGHYRVTAGTLGTCVIDTRPYPGVPGKFYILSNNHVLANSNNANLRDPILQPGPYDGGRYPRDLIARLSRFVPIRFRTGSSAPCNYVDAAIAEGNFHNLDRFIYWVGTVKGTAGVRLGQIVQKTGRTTNYTTGKVTGLNATVWVNYGGGKVAKMCRQIITTNMSAGGDSGSLLCDLNEKAVGLLFAGSSRVTIHNYIGYVLRMLGIRIP